MAWTQQEINECINLCKQKAAADAEFRRKLLSDPAAAIRELSGRVPDQGAGKRSGL